MAEEFEGEKLPYPAKQSEMKRQPDSDLSNYKAAGKLKDKVAIITGADSGVGRAVAIAFAMEGANVAIVYNENDSDAAETKRLCEAKGGKCLVMKSDVRYRQMCFDAVEKCVAEYGGLNILVNNAAFQMAQKKFEDIEEVFAVAHDPTQLSRQAPDTGTQYRSAIFYANDEQKRFAENYIAELTKAKTFERPIVTQVVKLDAFYKAEDYHQDYLAHHPTQPYIVAYDQPKVENLHKQFPDLYQSK